MKSLLRWTLLFFATALVSGPARCQSKQTVDLSAIYQPTDLEDLKDLDARAPEAPAQTKTVPAVAMQTGEAVPAAAVPASSQPSTPAVSALPAAEAQQAAQ